MRKLVFISFLIFQITHGQDTSKVIYKLSPTPDSTKSSGVYIPKNLSDCFVELDKMLHPSFINQFKTSEAKETIKYHHTLGMWIRNNWGLWKGDTLARWFNNKGIFHPDDMSGIILDSYWRSLNKRPIDLENQIIYYKDYWKKAKETN
jgi:hypothetical protein